MVRKQKFMILILIMVFLFSIIQIGHAFASAEKISLTNVEIINKSDTVYVDNITYENKEINNNITFHKVGDFVTYKITIKNNENKNYIIKSISDDNINQYITYEYNTYEGVILGSNEEKQIYITAKYSKELNDVSKRDQLFLVKFSLNIEDEKGNSLNEEIKINSSNDNIEKNNEDSKKTIKATSNSPKTGDNIWIYMLLAIISFISLLILLAKINNNSNNKGKKILGLFILIALILPTISKADNVFLDISIQNLFKIQDKLIINTQINGETISEIINYGDTLQKPENPKKAGYIFKGWFLDNGTEYDFNTPITEDLQINPKFEILNYDITYNLNGGTASNPISYTVEDEIVLNKPEKEGYLFTGWTGEGLAEETENVTISKGSTGNRVYTANYEPVKYLINYDLNGGTASNPNEYTIEDEITLNAPHKEGYNFIGWTGTGLNNNTENVTITRGSIGEKNYIANYEAKSYTIIYNELTDEERALLNNPSTYTIESENITLHNPSNRVDNDGDVVKRFAGWKENLTTSIDVTITTGTIGNKEYTAIWQDVEPNTYSITYTLNGGEIEAENPITFTKNTNTFTLNNPSKEGYNFTGWTGSNGNTPQTTVRVEKGTRENLNFVANYEPKVYTITYILNEGIASNEVSYTIESDDIILNQPTKEGYTFTGWTGEGLTEKTKNVTIQHGSTGNRVYTANYEANTYTIVFNYNTGTGNMANQTIEYDIQESLKPNSFTKNGYKFVGWNTNPDGSGRSFENEQQVKNLATGGMLTLYAQWSAIQYTVVFNSNGGTGTAMPNQEFCFDEEKNLSKNTYTNSGNIFIGWNTNADGTGTYYTDEKLVKNLTNQNGQTINLYAIWKKMSVGDYVNYNPASGFGNGLKFETSSAKEGTSLSGAFNSNDITRWRVLNIKDNGEIQLVAEKPTTQEVSLSGANGYINGEKLLDDIGEIYGSGLGAVSGRSIKLEDIEHYFKYDKTTFSNSYSSTGKYGGVRKYTSGNFIVDDEIVSASSTSPVTVTQTTYWYDVDDYAYTKAENEDAYNAYKMLCKDIQVATGTNATYTPYWISSRCAYLNSNGCWYYLHYIGDLHGVRKAEMGTRGLYSSTGTESSASIGVLPVVTLHPSIDYTYNLENNAWDINYTPISYNIKFNSNGGEGTMQDQTFYLGEQKALSEKTFTRSGYVFNGWNTLADGSGTSYTDKQIVKNLKTENSNITLYAQWNEIKLGETVTYNTSLNGVELNNWQIFYKNNDYVYLILKDYLPNSAIDDSLNVSKAKIYNVYGSNLYDVITTSSNWNNLLTGNINGKNIDYRNSQDSNIKATGSPTVDMFVQSWNEYYPDQALYLNNNETGYFIGKSAPATETELHFTDDYNHGSGFHFARWRDANNDGVTYGYWLASKSASSDAQSLLAAGFYIIQTPATVYNPEIASLKPGGQAFVAYARLGLRPVVCLPISVLQ